MSSKIFSKIEIYDYESMQSIEFNAPGFVRDEDDLLDIPGVDDWFEEICGDSINVNSEVYIFGSGESESATEEEVATIMKKHIALYARPLGWQ